MVDYIDIDEAIAKPGLRIVLTPGLPNPWCEAVKGILHLKKLPYIKARQDPFGGENMALRRWTAQASAPVAVFENEPPRPSWIDQLYLFERLQPEPRLIPEDFDDRFLMLGFAREICGVQGYGWHRRNEAVRVNIGPDSDNDTRAFYQKIGRKYGYTDELGAVAAVRMAEILKRLTALLERQRDRGSRFFVGGSLTALDIYWACHAATIRPLPNDLCPMPPEARALYTATHPILLEAASPILMEHRDFIYQNYLELPVDF